MNTQTTYLASKPHYEILDGLRGVAAVMVIVFHLFEAHAGGSHLTQIINHGYLAVDFFFMLSGFVIGYAYDDRWNHAAGNVTGLYLTSSSAEVRHSRLDGNASVEWPGMVALL